MTSANSSHQDIRVIKVFELPDYPFLLGVQWHPEKTLESEVTRRLFKGFVEECFR